MKTSTAIISFLFFFLPAFSQNNPPAITSITALADTIFHELVVTYDVSDSENDEMEILLSASCDGGILYNLNTSNATGDVGFPVSQGAGKVIVWQYPDSVSLKVVDFKVKLAADDRALDIGQIISQIDTGRLKQNAQFISGIRNHATGAQHRADVRDSLTARFQRYGLQTRLHEFPFDAFTGQNVIGKKTGSVSNTKTFIVDGHYDTVINSPGADDNGSGIAGILEILRVIAPLEFAYSVQFIAFDFEEAGLAGSKAFVPEGMMPDEDVEGAINMDMIGYFSDLPNSQTLPAGFNLLFPELYAELAANDFRANFIISTANSNSNYLLTLFDSMATKHVPSLLVGSVPLPDGIIIDDATRGDHASFWEAGYKALALSDGAETRNPNYHEATDVPATLNYNFMSNVTKAAAATLLSLAKPLHADIEVAQVAPDPRSSVWERGNGNCRFIVNQDNEGKQLLVSTNNCGKEEMIIQLISLEGKIMELQEFRPETRVEIDLGNISGSGYYLLEAGNSKNYFSGKIFIMR